MLSETFLARPLHYILNESGVDTLMVTSTYNAAGFPRTLQSMALDQGLKRSQVTLQNKTHFVGTNFT